MCAKKYNYFLKQYYQDTENDFCVVETCKNNIELAERDVILADYHINKKEFFEAIQLLKRAFRHNPDLFSNYKDKFRNVIIAYRRSLQ